MNNDIVDELLTQPRFTDLLGQPLLFYRSDFYVSKMLINLDSEIDSSLAEQGIAHNRQGVEVDQPK